MLHTRIIHYTISSRFTKKKSIFTLLYISLGVELTSTIIRECSKHSRGVNHCLRPPVASILVCFASSLFLSLSLTLTAFSLCFLVGARSARNPAGNTEDICRKVVSAINKDEASAIKCRARRSRLTFFPPCSSPASRCRWCYAILPRLPSSLFDSPLLSLFLVFFLTSSLLRHYPSRFPSLHPDIIKLP